MPTTKCVFENVEVGDEVMQVIRDHANGDKPTRYIFRRVTRVTARMFYVGECGYAKETGRAMVNKNLPHRVEPVTDAALAWRESARKKAEIARAEHDAYNAREDVKLARRISNMGDDTALALGLDRLRRIIAIIDESKCQSCGDDTGVCECA